MTSLITNIVAILGALGGLGGICSVFLFYRENKRTKQLENEHKSNDEWRSLVEEHKARERDLEQTIRERDAIIASKDAKIESLYKEKGECMKRNDKLSSTVAALSILRCKLIACSERTPPIGSRNTEEPDASENTEHEPLK